MAIRHPSTVGEPTEFTATQIFEQEIPRLLKTRRDVAETVGAVYVFQIKGKNGGTWTVNLNNLQVNKGDYEAPDMRLEMTTDDFRAMLNGKLDAIEAIQSKRVHFWGRPQLLVGLAALVRPEN